MANVMKRFVTCAAVVLLATGAAYGQDARAGSTPVSLADVSSHATIHADPPTVQEAADDPDEKSTWDNIKRGFYAGLVIGGLVGAIRAAECGHPECGPMFSFYAGVGAAIGLGIDALFDEPREAKSGSAHAVIRPRTPATGPRVMVTLRKSW